MRLVDRRLVSVAASLTLAVVALAVVAVPADAAAPPWRWKQVILSNQAIASGASGFYEVQCPADYVPVSGGVSSQFTGLYIRREYPDYNTNRYVMVVTNAAASSRTVAISTWCAHAADIGPIDTSFVDFPESSNRAGGVATCPPGMSLLSGGVDWFTTGDRHIDFSGPTPLGDGWYASGTSSATNDTLRIEVRCIADSSMPDSTTALLSSDVSGTGVAEHLVACPAGKRTLTGGTWAGPMGSNIRDTASRGGTSTSAPNGASSWYASATVTNSRFGVLVICIPNSVPTVAFTDTPPEVSTSSSGTFAFSASDPAGEELSYSCRIYSVAIPCTPGSSIAFGPLSDGPKELRVAVTNSSGFTTTVVHNFEIDTTPPTVTTRVPLTVAPLTGDFEMDFSEPVKGVDASTLRVYAGGSTTPIRGTLTVAPSANAATSANFDPQAPLLPGQTYRVELGSGIKDGAGLSLVPPDWEVRADPQVDDGSPVIKTTWDSDKSKKASGGRYISSRTKDSNAELTFTAPASGEVSLFGIATPKGGRARIYLDNQLARTASFYAKGTKRLRVFRATGLTPGSSHRLRVVVAGSKPAASAGTWVNLDSLTIGNKVKQEGALLQGFRHVDQVAAYHGGFTTIDHATGGDNGGKPEFRLKFRGTSISVHAVLGPGAGKAAIYVDGVLRKTVNLSAPGLAYDVEVFSRTLTDKVHEIRVVPVGTRSGKKSAVGIDRFAVG
jgi:hypothetical protein